MLYSTRRLDLLISFNSALWLRVAQVIGLGFLFVPVTLVAYVGIPPEKNNSISGIINFMRNMGSSVGTSIVTTLIARRSQYHQEILSGYASPGNPIFRDTVNGFAQHLVKSGLSPHTAKMQAYARIYQSIEAQAGTLAYIDTFKVLAVGASIMFFLSFILKKNDPSGAHKVTAE
jgi:DHA2 family multidrug resistance protein